MPVLTVDRLDNELKLSTRGDADGQKEFPASEASELSPIESLVVSRIDGEIGQKSNELLGIGSGQDFTTLPEDLEALASEPQTVLTQFRARKARAQSAIGLELSNAHTDFARAYRDYRSFRIQHGLTETEPSYDNVFWRKVFWLALLFVVEVAANGWMIGQASPGGLVQGWTTALMISVLVVLTGTLIGVGPWRYINYRGPEGRGWAHKLWAVPALVLGGGLLLTFAFYIAHYRFALSQTSLDAPVPDNILTSIMTAPFEPFQQLESLLLFVIALLIGIFAVARGAHWDDPYPGYGPRHRRVEDARERTQEIAERLSEEVDQAKLAADQALKDVAAKSQDSVSALRRAIAKTQDNAAIWDYTAAEIVTVGRDAIEIYREANSEARNTAAPRYFASDPFAGAAPPSSAEILDALRSAFSRATGNITACKSQLAGARAQLEAEYHSFYDDELAPFLKGIADSASVNVRTEFLDKPIPPRRAPDEAVYEDEEDEEEDEIEETPPIAAQAGAARPLFFQVGRGRR